MKDPTGIKTELENSELMQPEKTPTEGVRSYEQEKTQEQEKGQENRGGFTPEDLSKRQTKISTKIKRAVTIPQVRDEITVRIEKIMEEGLGDAYSRLSPVAKQEFKIKGEETANKIRELLDNAKVKTKNIFRLIWEWLKMLPGINHFFLEQEAKIKTDKILSLKNRQNHGI